MGLSSHQQSRRIPQPQPVEPLSLPSVRRYDTLESKTGRDGPEEVRLADTSYNGPALG